MEKLILFWYENCKGFHSVKVQATNEYVSQVLDAQTNYIKKWHFCIAEIDYET